MGKPKRGKTRSTGSLHAAGDDGEDIHPHQAYDITTSQPPDDRKEEGVKRYNKFELYQQYIREPKVDTDISYLQKFFLKYVERTLFHIQEDFCGTALLSLNWLRGDSKKRTAIGLDSDPDALSWCIEKNLANPETDITSRLSLLEGNVWQPKNPNADNDYYERKHDDLLLPRDIVCAFNYSCCCLLTRTELLLYFNHAFETLSVIGGIFVMDLFGGTSSEPKLKLRRISNFNYVWEQKELDTKSRRTKIGLHFYDGEKCVIRDAFSYDWRLWSLPEIKDCMEEAGFRAVHFWIKETPIAGRTEIETEHAAGRYLEYQEVEYFPQRDSWNAYIVGVK